MAGVMTDQPETFQRVSAAEAARLVGVRMAETIDELSAENVALVARTEAQTASRPLGKTRWSRRRDLALWLLGVLAIAAVAAPLVWPR